MTLKRLVCLEWLGTEGILGSPIYVSSSFIFLFLAFCHILKASGVGDWMTGLAGACGGSGGGPAKAPGCSQRFAGYHKRQLGGEYGKHRFDYNPVDEKIRL